MAIIQVGLTCVSQDMWLKPGEFFGTKFYFANMPLLMAAIISRGHIFETS